MSQTDPSVPTPPALPTQWVPIVSAVAGGVVLLVAPVVHRYFPSLPVLTPTETTAAVGLLVSVALWAHTAGLKVVATWLAEVVLPVLLRDVLKQQQTLMLAQHISPIDVQKLTALQRRGIDIPARVMALAAGVPAVVDPWDLGPMSEDDCAAVREARRLRSDRS